MSFAFSLPYFLPPWLVPASLNLPFRSISLLPGLLEHSCYLFFVPLLTDYLRLVIYLLPPNYTHKDLPSFFPLGFWWSFPNWTFSAFVILITITVWKKFFLQTHLGNKESRYCYLLPSNLWYVKLLVYGKLRKEHSSSYGITEGEKLLVTLSETSSDYRSNCNHQLFHFALLSSRSTKTFGKTHNFKNASFSRITC